jgi:penicillin-binding protein 2
MFNKKKKNPEIYPDEIFMDSKNIPEFDTQQFEGRLEKPISRKTFRLFYAFLGLVAIFFLGKIFYLQIIQGKAFAERAEKNKLKQEIILPPRAVIGDRNEVKLAWNEGELRNYINLPGFSHLLGYLGLPSKNDLEKGGDILMNVMIGKDGIERKYEDFLKGARGIKLVEIDSQYNITSESVQNLPVSSENLNLAIDFRIQSQFFKIMDATAKEHDFQGGAGIILDANSGEVLSMVNWPEYNSKDIENSLNDKNNPFLNRAISGFYAPGSIIKPIIALAALNEGTISPEKQIFSSGSISIPNPFFPDKKSVFYDWKAHGWVDMRKAIAVSSDVYFYEVGGGFEGQKGLGIKKIEEYAKKFGLGSKTGIDLSGEGEGTIPNPELKAKSNPEDPIWRIGDTYNASIGQGYFHITPIEVAIYAAALANSGKIIQPHLILNQGESLDSKDSPWRDVGIPEKYFKIVKEGMRMSVTEGTASALNVSSVDIAAKTGTAEVGGAKKYVNSLVIGFFPYENPRYAFAVVMEKGPYHNTVGAPYVMRQLIDWLSIYTPEYLK